MEERLWEANALRQFLSYSLFCEALQQHYNYGIKCTQPCLHDMFVLFSNDILQCHHVELDLLFSM